MTILLTGGTGKTGLPLVSRIYTQSTHTVLLASRRGIKPNELSGFDHSKLHAVKFDWLDRTSWSNPFDYVASQEISTIDAVYLVAPSVWHVEFMKDFIDFAKEKGASRFVLLSASQTRCGDPSTGRVHEHLKRLGEEGEVEWGVLRPTWFIENLGEYQLQAIRDEDAFYSVWEDGKVPFVSASDIAGIAYEILVEGRRLNDDWFIHGPELFTNDEVACILSGILSRTITHKRITREEYLQLWGSAGYDELAQGLVDGELRIAQGSEEVIFEHEKAVKGKIRLREYIERNKHLWIPGSG